MIKKKTTTFKVVVAVTLSSLNELLPFIRKLIKFIQVNLESFFNARHDKNFVLTTAHYSTFYSV